MTIDNQPLKNNKARVTGLYYMHIIYNTIINARRVG